MHACARRPARRPAAREGRSRGPSLGRVWALAGDLLDRGVSSSRHHMGCVKSHAIVYSALGEALRWIGTHLGTRAREHTTVAWTQGGADCLIYFCLFRERRVLLARLGEISPLRTQGPATRSFMEHRTLQRASGLKQSVACPVQARALPHVARRAPAHSAAPQQVAPAAARISGLRQPRSVRARALTPVDPNPPVSLCTAAAASPAAPRPRAAPNHARMHCRAARRETRGRSSLPRTPLTAPPSRPLERPCARH